MSRCRWSAAQLHGTAAAASLPPEERKRMGIETDVEIQTRLEKEGERALQRESENLLRLRGIPFIHLRINSRQSPGWPDLVFPIGGRFWAVELKTRTGKLSEDQTRILGELVAAGAVVHVCRTFAEFRAALGGAVETLFALDTAAGHATRGERENADA